MVLGELGKASVPFDVRVGLARELGLAGGGSWRPLEALGAGVAKVACWAGERLLQYGLSAEVCGCRPRQPQPPQYWSKLWTGSHGSHLDQKENQKTKKIQDTVQKRSINQQQVQLPAMLPGIDEEEIKYNLHKMTCKCSSRKQRHRRQSPTHG
jgi:hypothetical protein